MGADALEAARERLRACLRGLWRQLRGQLTLAARLDAASGGVERRSKDDVRVAVRRAAPERFAQPVDRALGIAIERVGVPEVEEHVRIVRLPFGRFREEIRRLARLHGPAPAQLDDA